MPFCMCCAARVPGVCCPMICPVGLPPIGISADGNSREFGNRSMLHCGENCVFLWEGRPNRVRLFSPVNQSKPVRSVAISVGSTGGKKIQGRKRNLLVDKLGLLMSVSVL